MLIRRPAGVPLKATGALGEFPLLEAVCKPILNTLQDYRPQSLGEIETGIADQGLRPMQVVEVVLTLDQQVPLLRALQVI